MRFKPYKHGLSVLCSDAEMEAGSAQAVACLTQHGAKKVYLLVEPSGLLAGTPPGATRIVSGQKPSNFLSSFRVIVRPGEIALVSPVRFINEKQWRAIAEAMTGRLQDLSATQLLG